MRKIITIFIVLIVMCCLLSSCNSKGATSEDAATVEISDAAQNGGVNTSDRKIIYKASARIDTENLKDTIAIIKNNIAEDEWCDNETISNGYATFVVRVKSGRLDAFMTALATGGEISNYTMTATDVSLTYQDTTNRIASLTAESARLDALYAEASLYDMITINQRLSAINLELINLQGTLNQYDSLIEYSEVTLAVYQNAAEAEEIPFGQKLSKVFKDAWSALGTFFKGVLVVIAAVFPFAVVFVPATVGIFFLAKFLKIRKKIKLANKYNRNMQNKE